MCIFLPQGEIKFQKNLAEAKTLLVAGGRPPADAWIKTIAANYPVWCVDSGIEVCKKNDIRPERLIGDGDSASEDAWNWAKKMGVGIDKYNSEKDLTDLQIALKTLGTVRSGACAIITGGWGGRFDHNWANILSMVWSREWGVRACCITDEQETLFLLEGPDAVEVTLKSNLLAVSLLAISPVCNGVSIDGVYWPLKNEDLYCFRPYAISNRMKDESSKLSVTIDSGMLGVYIKWI